MSNPFDYTGKRVVVTGAATGVGAGLLEVLAELDAAHVTVLDLKAPTGPHDVFLPTDLSDPAAVDAAVAAIDGGVDALFNNAGVADTMPPRTVIAVNFLALRRLSESLLDRIPDGGAIVNTASTAGGQWADAPRCHHRGARPRRLGQVARVGRHQPGRPRRAAVLLLQGARAGVHDALVAADDPPRHPHEQRVPVAHRHAAARRLPPDDVRQAHRLERRRRRTAGW